MTLKEMKLLPEEDQKALYNKIKAIRLKAKKVNFASLYGAGIKKISLTAGINLSEARLLHSVYWDRNWAIKSIAENTEVKTVRGQMWQLNMVSQFWYSLRADKDRFSTLNQGTGVYCFDTWLKYIRKQKVRIAMQYHDECLIPLPKNRREQLSQILNTAIEQTNAELQLNIELGISIDFGHSYASVH